MNQGIFIPGWGPFRMKDRADLGDKDSLLQKALKCYHHKRGISCGCRIDEGVELPMEVVKIATEDRVDRRPTEDPNQPEYRVDRRSIEDPHHLGCIFCKGTDGDNGEPPLPASAIFDELKDCSAATGIGLGPSGGGSSIRFVQFSRLMMSRGYTNAWEQANERSPDWAGLRNPSALEVFVGIDEAIRNCPLRDAANGYEGAEQLGAGLVFGVLETSLPQVAGAGHPGLRIPLLLSGFRERRLDAFYATADAALIEQMRDSVGIFTHAIKPPYLFFAVIEPDWSLRRLCIKSIFLEGDAFAFVDSDAERHFFRPVTGKRLVYYRALDTMRDYETLPERFQVVPRAIEMGRWDYCPDAVVYQRAKAYVVELRGFAPGTNPGYDDLFDRKGDYYPAFIGSAPVKYEERSLVSDPRYSDRQPKADPEPIQIARGCVDQELPPPADIG